MEHLLCPSFSRMRSLTCRRSYCQLGHRRLFCKNRLKNETPTENNVFGGPRPFSRRAQSAQGSSWALHATLCLSIECRS
jgi:hypothetical protein